MTVQNILTVDLEDWYHICGVQELLPESHWPRLESRVVATTSKILDILDRHRTRATFFVLGFIAERHPEIVLAVEKAGHEIATHGYGHHRVYTQSPEAFRRDIKKALEILSGITSRPVRGYRAPEWSIRDESLWALDILVQEGFLYDSSKAPLPVIGNPDYSRIPHRLDLQEMGLWEFPPLVGVTPLTNLPFGGGWGLRVFPYRFIRNAIQKLNHAGLPGVVYLHPREFDTRNPKIRLPPAKRFVLNAGVEKTEKRLNRLFQDFSFTSVSTFLENRREIP